MCEPIEHAAMTGDDSRAVFHAGLALEQRLGEIADLGSDANESAEENESPRIPFEAELRCGAQYAVAECPSNPDGGDQPSDSSFNRFAGADRRNQLMPADPAADGVGADIGRPCRPQGQHEEQ